MDAFDRVAQQVAAATSAASSRAAQRLGTAVADSTGGHVQVQIGAQTWTVTDRTGRVTAGDQVTVIEQDNHAVITSIVSEQTEPGIPVGGTILWWSDQIPAGWAKCDGSTFDTAAYPVVAALLGSGTLPDLRDRFPVGASSAKSVRSAGGSTAITVDNMPPHSHAIKNSSTAIAAAGSNLGEELLGTSTSRGWRTEPDGGGSAYWQPYRAGHWIIRMG